MTPQDLMLHFRGQVKDEAQPYLWPDPEVLVFLADAQDMFVRLTKGIADVTVAVADIGSPQTRLQDLAVTVDNPWAALSPYIMRVRSARLLTAKVDVQFVNEADVGTIQVKDYGWAQTMSFDDTDTGDVRYAVLGVREKYVRWLRVPAAIDTCRLHVLRLPYPRLPLTLQGLDTATLEVDEQHHLNLVEWMKYKAYLKEDAETYDKALSDRSEGIFRKYCEQARQEIERQRFKPRVVQYGGL